MSRTGGQVARTPGSAFGEYREGQQQRVQCGRRGSAVVSALTVALPATYQRCSPHFTYSSHLVPRRVLTKPSEGVENQGYDNANSDLVVCVHDVFISTTGTRYVVKDLLGQGTFGQVFRCVEQDSGGLVAVKVIKNQPAYYHQARVEVGVLQYLNTRADPHDKHHIVRMKDFFLFRNHLCLAFELLNVNLYELIRHNKFRGLSLPLVRVFTTQILDALVVLRDSRIVHCDLKPENVLLKTIETGEVKVIDFGSACFENRTVYSYIQSRFYRSPEVVVGYPYTMAIDMWSLGCMAAELYLGLPLFPGACEHDLLCRMVSMLGALPDFLLAHGKHTHKFFKLAQEEVVTDAATGEAVLRRRYAVRSREEFEAATGQAAPTGKNYFSHTSLADIIGAYPIRGSASDEAVAREKAQREAFVDFLLGVLDLDPATRWTPRQALQHPFITGEPFTGPFQPPADPTSTPSGTRRWGDASPSPTPVGTPMSIPATRNTARSSAGGAGGMGTPWPPGAGAGSAAAAAALMATSPQVHAQAHAAAMAAVQAQMSLRQQQQVAAAAQQQQQAAAAAGLQNGYYMPPPGEYNAAHSLQAILPTLAAVAAASYGVGSLGGTPMAHSLTTPLLSPPSRSFGPHLRYGDYGAGAGSGLLDGLPSGSLHTPRSAAGGVAFSPMQLGSFTPSSVTTYQAALAAAHVAMAQQQQQQQQQQLGGMLGSAAGQQALDSVALLSQSARLAAAAGAGGLQPMQQSPYHRGVLGVAAASSRAGWGTPAGAALAQQQAAAAATVAGRPGAAAAGAGPAAQLPPYLPQQEPAAAAALLAGGGLGEASRAGSRWVSMEGSMDGTPPRLGADGLTAAAAADESGPNPADWDPLWSDDLLEEDSQAGGRSPEVALKSAAPAGGRAASQPQQAGAAAARSGPPLFRGEWFREPGGAQAGQEQRAQRRSQPEEQPPAEPSGGSPGDAELPGSYCLPLPSTLLLGLQGSSQQASTQPTEPREQGRGEAAGADLPLPSRALLGASGQPPQPPQQQQQAQRGREEAAQPGRLSQAPPPSFQPPAQRQAPGGGSGASEHAQLATMLLAAAHQSAQTNGTEGGGAGGVHLAAGPKLQPYLQQAKQQQQQHEQELADAASAALDAWQQHYRGDGRGEQQPVASSSFEFHLGGARQQMQVPLPPAQGQQQQQQAMLSPFLLQQQQAAAAAAQLQLQQAAQLRQAAAATSLGAPGFALQGTWQAGGDASGAGALQPGLDAAAMALQHALSAQLSTRLTQDLALSGLSGEEAATAVAAYQAPLLSQQQQQQLHAAPMPAASQWGFGVDEQQQQLAMRQQHQPMQRMQGFDIMK